jgi:hypothetical protein
MATLVCVLRSGGRYTPEWVRRLRGGVARFSPGFHRFVCLSDRPFDLAGVEVVPLMHDWPAWWSKMEAFRPGLTAGTTVLCDLDTVFAGDAPELALPGGAAMEDYFLKGRLSSAVMRWDGGELGFLYDAFARRPEHWMAPGSCGPVPNSVHGDQVVIDHLLRERGGLPPFIQDVHPGLLDFYDPDAEAFGPVVIFIGASKPDGAVEPLRAIWEGRAP